MVVVREDWLAQVQEEIVDPGRRVVDPHHHFFATNEEFPRYGLDELWADTGTHRVEQTVYVQCWEGYREEGPEHLRVVGETEWVDRIAAQARRRPLAAQIGAIVGTADLRKGERVREVLDAHCAASKLFRGIRQIAAWDASDALWSAEGLVDGNLYGDPAFREGFAVLAEMDLVFDAFRRSAPLLTQGNRRRSTRSGPAISPSSRPAPTCRSSSVAWRCPGTASALRADPGHRARKRS